MGNQMQQGMNQMNPPMMNPMANSMAHRNQMMQQNQMQQMQSRVSWISRSFLIVLFFPDILLEIFF